MATSLAGNSLQKQELYQFIVHARPAWVSIPQWSHNHHISHPLIHKCLHKKSTATVPSKQWRTPSACIPYIQCRGGGSGLCLGPHYLVTRQQAEWLCLPPAPVAGKARRREEKSRRKQGKREGDTYRHDSLMPKPSGKSASIGMVRV